MTFKRDGNKYQQKEKYPIFLRAHYESKSNIFELLKL